MRPLRAVAVLVGAAWAAGTAGIVAGAVTGAYPWSFPAAVLGSLAIGYGLPALWYGTGRAVPGSHSRPAPTSPGAGRKRQRPRSPDEGGASGGARYLP